MPPTCSSGGIGRHVGFKIQCFSACGFDSRLEYKTLVNHLIFKGNFHLHTQVTGLFLDAQKKEDIINFLKTLTDDVYLNNEEYKNSFE